MKRMIYSALLLISACSTPEVPTLAVGGIYLENSGGSITLIKKEKVSKNRFIYQGLTCYHVVDGVNEDFIAAFSFDQEKQFISSSKILKINSETDLALIEFAAPFELNILEIDFDYEYEVGNDIHTISCPNNQFPVFTHGVIAGLNIYQTQYSIYSNISNSDCFRIDSALIFGSSGGAVLSKDYKLIGIVRGIDAVINGKLYPILTTVIKNYTIKELLK